MTKRRRFTTSQKPTTRTKKKTDNLCRWCKKDHLREYSEGFCFKKNEKKIRSRLRPQVRKIEEVFNERGQMRAEFIGTDIEDQVRNYHRRSARVALTMNGDGGYRLSLGVRQAMKLPLTQTQISHRYPWAVIVIYKGRRMRKLCANLATAVGTHRHYEQRGYNATIVSRARGYDIPPALRGKLPKGWVWCPFCMKARKYKALGEGEFYAIKKVWSSEKQKYVFKERKLQVTRCGVCQNTNRDAIYRRSNQPWEKRRIKKGARRVKRRYRTRRVPGKGFKLSARS